MRTMNIDLKNKVPTNTKVVAPVLLALVALSVTGVSNLGDSGPSAVAQGEDFQYNADVQMEVVRDGEVIYSDSASNLLTDEGLRYFQSRASDGGHVTPSLDTGTFSDKHANVIALSTNETYATAQGHDYLEGEITEDATNLTRAQATYTDNGVGSWNYEYTFTANSSYDESAVTGDSTSDGYVIAEASGDSQFENGLQAVGLVVDDGTNNPSNTWGSLTDSDAVLVAEHDFTYDDNLQPGDKVQIGWDINLNRQ